MRIIALKCSECSAPLDVPAEREQLTCVYCGSMLHTSQLAAAGSARDSASEKPAVTEIDEKIGAELRQLDREWETYRQQYVPRDGSGEYVIPEPDACRMGAWVTGTVGGGLTILGVAAGAWGITTLCVLVTAIVLTVLLKQAKIAPVYQRSLEDYCRERTSILRRLGGSVRGSADGMAHD